MMFPIPIAVALLTLVSSFSSAAALPTLYDIEFSEGYISPLDTSKFGGGGFGYGRELRVSVIPAQKGAPVTQYEIQEIASDANVPVNSQAFAWSTVLPGAVTRTYTMDQGASTLHFSVPPALITTAAIPLRVTGVVRDCSLNLEKKEGVCVEEVQLPLITTITEPATTAMSTYTSTYTTTFTRGLQELKFANGGLSLVAAPVRWLSTVVCIGVAVGVFLT